MSSTGSVSVDNDPNGAGEVIDPKIIVQQPVGTAKHMPPVGHIQVDADVHIGETVKPLSSIEVQDEGDQIQPHDSVSNVSNGSGKTSSTTLSKLRLKNIQKEIELKQKLAALEEQNTIDDQIKLLQRKKTQIQLESELIAAMEVNKHFKLQSDPEVTFRSPQRVNYRENQGVRESAGESEQHLLPSSDSDTLHPTSAKSVPSETLVKDEDDNVSMKDILNRLIQSQREQALPTQDIKIFDGSNPLEFPTFMQNIKYVVENNTQDSARRLELLIKYTKGDAYELLKQCPMIIPPSKAYETAKSLLKRDYGNPHILAAAFKKEAEEWPRISSGDKVGLRKYSLFLISCCNVKQSNSEMSTMDGYEFLRLLASKLPTALQQRWITQVGRFREDENKSATLEDFEYFVGKISRDENDPRISGLGYQFTRKPQHQPLYHQRDSTSKKVFSTQVNNDYKPPPPTPQQNSAITKPCSYCGDNTFHSLLSCHKFNNLTIEGKSESALKLGLCFRCLNRGHMGTDCPNISWTRCAKCPRPHVTIMHDPRRDRIVNKFGQARNPEQKSVVSGYTEMSVQNIDFSNPLMAITPICVKSKLSDSFIITYAFVDQGSSAVFIDYELASNLKVRQKKKQVSMKTINSEEVVDLDMVLDTLQVSEVNGGEYLDLPNVYVKDKMPVSIDDAPTSRDLEKWEHLRGISIPDILKCGNYIVVPQVTMMIGMNMPAATMPLEVVSGKIGEPYAIKSPIGWLVYGLPGKMNRTININFVEIGGMSSNLESQFRDYVNMDFSERLCEDKHALSVEDKKFLKVMDESIVLKDNNHYETKLPFKNRSVNMPNNKMQAEMFVYKLKNRLLKDETLFEQYSTFMNSLEANKFAEKVPIYDINRSDGRVWLITHHSVTNPKKPNKVRCVFNCPLPFMNTSLNEQLMQGPDLTNLLLGVLIRWRQDFICVMSDICSMFYQVNVQKDDCDMLRYLWFPDSDLNKPPIQYRMLVHPFGAVSSPSCANYALKRVAIDNKDDYSTETLESINRDFYVDDFLKSVSSENEAISLVQELRSILTKGGFHLTKWVSNSKDVLLTIPEEDRAMSINDIDISADALPVQRALGVQWNIATDAITFSRGDIKPTATRRNILSVMSSIYDPFGIASPFVLQAKLILQQLCKEKLSWDEPIPSNHKRDWDKWINDIQNLENLKVNRCLKPKDFSELIDIQMHHFADACADSYGTVTYLRFEDKSGRVYVSYLLGRSRVAPIRPHTIVKLELAAATAIVKINNMLTRELTLPVNNVYFWTDSQTVLKYINNDTMRHQVFVANRVAIIRDGSNIDKWYHVPGKLNPADLASRGSSAHSLIHNSNWLQGPDFLWKPISEWPEQPILSNDKPETLPVCTVALDDKSSVTMDRLFEYYSEWYKLKRSVAWWLRLKEILRLKVKKADIPNRLLTKSLSVDEINNSETEIVKSVQRCSFPEEHKLCCESKSIKLKSDIVKLDPFVKDGILRVGGRLRNAKLPYDSKHQVILPKNHHVSTLIIKHCHVKVGHSGRNHTLSELRKTYWIVKAGVMVKGILSKCVRCRKYQARIGEQKMADIPSFRLETSEIPFTYCGMDYFGHFDVKLGRSMKKRYGVVFSCLTSRAVHIEVADSLDTSSCISAIRRFCARRGFPKKIFSDNGTNLIGACNELKESLKELNQTFIENFTVKNGIKWHFNPPAASHHGGAWERIIRTIRKILHAILSEQYLKTSQSDEELRTFFCEVESIINSRPLTRVSDDPDDLNPITPNSLLLGQSNVTFPPGLFTDKDVYARKRWRQIQYLSDIFWKRFSKEYLSTLQKREKWIKPSRNFNIGDVVLVVDSNAPRASWIMGRVIEIFSDKSGLVRSVRIKTKTTTLIRPIVKLCIILEQDN